jgi:lipopolysaccharide transport protein LptA
MRNSGSEHNQPMRCPLLQLLPWTLPLLLHSLALAAQEGFTISSEDMVSIRADQAWEDIEPGTLHFAGHFEMHIRDWLVNADRATLHGKLDHPDRLVLEGTPARFRASRTEDGRTESVQAEAREIVYERETERVILNGAARLVQGENQLQSNMVEYDIRSNRFRARGDTGVQLVVPTEY